MIDENQTADAHDDVVGKLSANDPIRIREAARYLGVSTSTLYKLTASRKIFFHKPGGKLIYFKKEDLDEYIFHNEFLEDLAAEDRAVWLRIEENRRKRKNGEL